MQHLPVADRTVIETLAPYPEGNADLWALHHLDILRKHRRLPDVRIQPIHLFMEGALQPGDFTPLATGIIQVNDEIVLGLLRKGVPPVTFQSRFCVALSEQALLERR